MKHTTYLATALLILATVSAQMVAKVHHVNGKELEKLLTKYDNVVVKFFAPWCPPCKQFNPIFEKVAKEFNDDEAVFASVDCDAHPDVRDKYGVRHFPTVLYFKNGNPLPGEGKKRDAKGFEKEVESKFEL